MNFLILSLCAVLVPSYTTAISEKTINLRYEAYGRGSSENASARLQECLEKREVNQALIYAASLGNHQILITLISGGADVSYRGTYINRSGILTLDTFVCTALELAAENGHRECVNILIKAKANVNLRDVEGETPLIKALKNKHAECASFLLQEGANPNGRSKEGRTVLSLASSISNAGALIDDCMKAFVNEIGEDGFTALHHAVKNESLESLQALIKNGANVSIRSKRGSTALHEAALKGNTGCIKVLLERRSDLLDMQDDSLSTALHYAIGNIECIRFLISMRANVNLPDKFGNVTLHLALYNGDAILLDVLKILYEAGARCDLKNGQGLTPLHLAAELGLSQCVKYLVRSQEDLKRKDIRGRTALDIIKEIPDENLIRYQPELATRTSVIITDGSVFNHVREAKKLEFAQAMQEASEMCRD